MTKDHGSQLWVGGGLKGRSQYLMTAEWTVHRSMCTLHAGIKGVGERNARSSVSANRPGKGGNHPSGFGGKKRHDLPRYPTEIPKARTGYKVVLVSREKQKEGESHLLWKILMEDCGLESDPHL